MERRIFFGLRGRRLLNKRSWNWTLGMSRQLLFMLTCLLWAGQITDDAMFWIKFHIFFTVPVVVISSVLITIFSRSRIIPYSVLTFSGIGAIRATAIGRFSADPIDGLLFVLEGGFAGAAIGIPIWMGAYCLFAVQRLHEKKQPH